MKVITWNCNMSFRKKAAMVRELKPDLLIVPECECPERLEQFKDFPKPHDLLWYGRNEVKGLGIFSFTDFQFRVHRNYNPAIQYVIPIQTFNAQIRLTLFAIWAHNPDDPDGRYVEQIWKAIHYYQRLIRTEKTLLVGDFNSNTIWDRPQRIGNHSDVVAKLTKKGIQSAYHVKFGTSHGSENHPTLFLYRHRDRPYHIDYCFASNDLLCKLRSVEVGDFDGWIPYSDHVPLIVDFEL